MLAPFESVVARTLGATWVGVLAAGGSQTPAEQCMRGIRYRIAGVAGIALVGLGCHLLRELGAVLTEAWRDRRRPRAPRLARPVDQGGPGVGVDIGAEVRRRKRRSRVASAATVVGIFLVAALLPSPVIAVVLLGLGGIIGVTAVALRDLTATGYWEETDPGDRGEVRPKRGGLQRKVGPPLFVTGKHMAAVVTFVFVASHLMGFGLLQAWVATGLLVCPEEGLSTGRAAGVSRAGRISPSVQRGRSCRPRHGPRTSRND
jgi:hypothetical protein